MSNNRSIEELERRSRQIISELDHLENRKTNLLLEQSNLIDLIAEMKDDWSKISLEGRFRKLILSFYGSNHGAKMAILDLNPIRGNSNEIVGFHPNVKFIGPSFNILSLPKLDLSSLVPTVEQVFEYEQKYKKQFTIEQITVSY